MMISLDNNNIGSSLQQLQQKQMSLLEKLASGKQVNGTYDDPAAQRVIDRLTSQGQGSSQSMSNAYDRISLAQVAESDLANISDEANHMRELTTQAQANQQQKQV
jgi:flagellin